MTCSTRRPLALVVLAALASGAGAAGCSFPSTVAPDDVRNTCAVDADCAQGTCDPDAQLCVADAEVPIQVGFELRTNDRLNPGTSVSHWIGPFTLETSGELDLEITPPITVTGIVKDELEELVQADVRLTRQPDFVGAPAVEVAITTVTNPITALDMAPATFAANVASDDLYEITISPIGEFTNRFPPLRRTLSVPGGGSFFRVDVVYPSDLPVFSGILVDRNDTPIDHLSVRAVDAATGRVVSTAAVSGDNGMPGEFTITLAPDVTDYLLRIGPSPTRAAFPSVNVTPSLLIPGPGEATRVLVPTPEIVTFRGVAVDEESAPVPGTIVSLRAAEVLDEETSILGSMQASATADEDGRFSLDVVTGEYEVILSPPTQVDAAPEGAFVSAASVGAYRMAINEGSQDEEVQFVLSPQERLKATITTFDDRFMSGATIDATALGRTLTDSDDPAEAYNRSLLGTLGAAAGGSLDISLDPGVYDVVVKAPEDRGYPWLPIPAFEMKPDADPAYFVLPAPLRVHGAVSSEDRGLASVEIRAWALIVENGVPRTVPIGRVVTDEDGLYSLLLPSRF